MNLVGRKYDMVNHQNMQINSARKADRNDTALEKNGAGEIP